MVRYLIETSKVDARMVHHVHGFSFGDKGGLLDEYGFLRNPQWVQGLKTLEDVANERGAVIIAESGLGKSYIARKFAREKGEVAALFIDVQEYRGDSPALVAAIREAQEKQYICLDGLDEAPELANAIARGFGVLSSSVKRLIFSRGIPELRRFTANDALPMYSLLPLTQTDVMSLAKDAHVDGESFFGEVTAKGLGPVCAKPLECGALLEMFKAGNGLRGNCDELRKRMILHLCAENEKDPRRYSSYATVSPGTCFSYAKKIALILKLSGLSVIKRMDEMGAVSGAVDFAQYGDLFDAPTFNRILSRGLFLPIGADRFRFAHITYFDYLAAHGLMECVAPKNWREILMNGEGVVYPQWENAVAWVAIKDEEVYNAVFTRQPELLLNSDATVAKSGPDGLCRAVLMRAAQMDYWSRLSSGIVLQFSKLMSPDTVGVLRESLRMGEENCREMAIDIIKRCVVRELIPDLVELFCDETVPHEVRKSAGYALLWMGPLAAEVRDCKVVLGQSKCSLSLKGIVFRLLWPGELTAKEMTPHLKTKKDSVCDSYSMWISDECPKRFAKMSFEDALEMARWAGRGVKDGDDAIRPLRELKSKVFTYCLKKFDDDKMYGVLAGVYERFCEKFKSPISLKQDYEENSDCTCTDEELKGLVVKRRRLAEAVIRRGHKNAVLWVTGWVCDLLGPTDVDFLEEKIKAETDGDVLLRWVQCAGRLQWGIQLPERAEYWDLLHKRFPEVFKLTAHRALAERKKAAQKHRRHQLKMKARLATQERGRKTSYSASLRKIKESIAKGELGKNFYNFVNYCYGQHLESKHNEWGFHVCSSRVWEDLSADEKNGVVLAAEDFLLNAKAPPRKNANEIYLAPFASFVLLQEVAPQKLQQLPREVWREFRFELMQGGSVDKSESALAVLQCYYRLSGNDFVDSLVMYLQCPRTEGVRFHLGQFKRMLTIDQQLCLTLLQRLDADDLSDSQRFELLDEFWETDRSVTLEYLRKQELYRRIDLVKHPLLSVFALYAFPERFSELLTKLDECAILAREWIIAVVGKEPFWNSSLGYLLKKVHSKELAKFYLVMRKIFPLKDAPSHSGAYAPDALDNVYTFASQLISLIYERKSPELVSVFEMLVRELPEERWLRDHLFRARKDALSDRCPIYEAKDIRAMLDEKSQAFLVNTPEALLRVVLSALEKYNLLLSGKTSHRARLLWNVHKRTKTITHKDEEDLSDDMRDFLCVSLRGLILNREVQLNRGRHGESGARTDLWVEAVDGAGVNKLTLCIEVKGSWNRTAKTAIENQLIHKYMGAGGADAGILVLGWFDAPAPNNVKNQWKTIAQAKRDLDSQVRMVRTRGNIVSSEVLDCSW